MTIPEFSLVTLSGDDSIKFLQGQLTCNAKKINDHYQATAISNLKGRIQFGIWIKKIDDIFNIVVSSDCSDQLVAHIKKFGAFSKIVLSNIETIYPYVVDNEPSFTNDSHLADVNSWMRSSIATANYWITNDMQDIYQPQELRLHQRGGVDYDKGCYLGQEVIARIYFKSSPKSFLHRISGNGVTPKSNDTIGEKSKVQVINSITISKNKFEALVISRPDLLEEFDVLDLPSELMESVSRK